MIGRNTEGYFTCSDDRSCLLLSTLNLLQVAYNVEKERSYVIIDRFGDLISRDESMFSFANPLLIPRTIEHLTEGEFRGIMVGPNARQKLKEMGQLDPDKYAQDGRVLNDSVLPCLYVLHQNGDWHSVAVPRLEAQGFLVINNGQKQIIPELTGGTVFRVVRN